MDEMAPSLAPYAKIHTRCIRMATELTENDVIEATCLYLENRGWTVEQRATTMDRGFDVVARGPGDSLLRVEAKGATSSKPGSARHGRPFSRAQINAHVARALYTAVASLGSAPASTSDRSAIALPGTQQQRHFVDRIKAGLHELGIGVLWVDGPDAVSLEARWEL